MERVWNVTRVRRHLVVTDTLATARRLATAYGWEPTDWAWVNTPDRLRGSRLPVLVHESAGAHPYYADINLALRTWYRGEVRALLEKPQVVHAVPVPLGKGRGYVLLAFEDGPLAGQTDVLGLESVWDLVGLHRDGVISAAGDRYRCVGPVQVVRLPNGAAAEEVRATARPTPMRWQESTTGGHDV